VVIVFRLAGVNAAERPAMSAVPNGLRAVIEQACAEAKSPMGALTVLSVPVDPYRLDTPANHTVGKWFAEQMGRLNLLNCRLHLRGIHYALLGSTAMPTGEPYANTSECWEWLQSDAAKAARWLGYVPFDAITDARNEPPVILVQPRRQPEAWVSVEPDIILPSVDDLEPRIHVTDFEGRQPYRLALYGEKTSLAAVLRPIAERFGADLYLPTGEISDTQLHIMAKNGAEDGRRLIIFTVADFDPAGWQMPVSIGRKLQAFHDLLFPDLEFEVRPIALTREQAEQLNLPSTPLKETERRADRWRAAMGLEQTEVDALATLRPDALRLIVEDALAPFHDADLSPRVWEAKIAWQDAAGAALAEQLGDEHLAALHRHLAEQIDTIREQLREIEEQARLSTADLDVTLPPIAIPEPDVDESLQGLPLISSAWPWSEQTRSLIARKSYGNGAT
jgi:hypothetical protein